MIPVKELVRDIHSQTLLKSAEVRVVGSLSLI